MSRAVYNLKDFETPIFCKFKFLFILTSIKWWLQMKQFFTFECLRFSTSRYHFKMVIYTNINLDKTNFLMIGSPQERFQPTFKSITQQVFCEKSAYFSSQGSNAKLCLGLSTLAHIILKLLFWTEWCNLLLCCHILHITWQFRSSNLKVSTILATKLS